MLPAHGKIQCRACFNTEEGSVTQPHPDWRMVNDPGAWGGSTPRYVVLGFSKGATQANIYDRGRFEDVAFSGMRARLTQILREIGALTATETADEMIANPASQLSFGSLIRCSVSRRDNKQGNAYASTGQLIVKSFDEIPGVIAKCTQKFLSELPDSVEIVALLGNGDLYVERCQNVIRSLYPNSFQRINEMAVRAGGKLWIHLPHPSGLNGHFNDWIEGKGGQGRKRELVMSVLGANTHATSTEMDMQVKEEGEQATELTTLQNPRIEYRHKSGLVFVPHRYGNGKYVVSKTRFKSDQVEVETLEDVQRYLDRGYKVRVSDPVTRRSPSLVGKDSLRICCGD